MRCLVFALGMIGAIGVRPSPTLAAELPPVALRDGDRVVLVGDALIERMQDYGYLETMLTASYPDRTITFRNLGWSGDTVFGEARAGFGTPEDGFKALVEQVNAARPTVLVLSYGANESWASEAGLPRFREGLNRLLDAMEATGARAILFLPPLPQENLGPPRPSPSDHNEDLALYRDAIVEIVSDRGHPVLDVAWNWMRLDPDNRPSPAVPVTTDGLHLNAFGYWRLAQDIAIGLGVKPVPWKYNSGDRDEPVTKGMEIRSAGEAKDSSITIRDDRLPPPPAPPGAPRSARWPGYRRIWIEPSARSRTDRFTLSIDGEPVVSATGESWASGVSLCTGPEFDQVEALRRAIIEKNRLYFHRWRPQNSTYLFGFRKHEQGNNAVEVERFDALVTQAEADINRLKRPMPHDYQFHPTEVDQKENDR